MAPEVDADCGTFPGAKNGLPAAGVAHAGFRLSGRTPVAVTDGGVSPRYRSEKFTYDYLLKNCRWPSETQGLPTRSSGPLAGVRPSRAVRLTAAGQVARWRPLPRRLLRESAA